ncbi:MAG TPA: hypothetical protein PKY35_06165 [Candidatus Hydrogenedentes bacterium]|nr:hypothetical protein [Candidatus Hydrogenedentota bacterium]HOL76597.1 hypothetical protein [Candidatus Hydrogenedentota bacterium]HPO84430.1 hypothetical protein [Candidatus Hydrogenedentota bacterium]
MKRNTSACNALLYFVCFFLIALPTISENVPLAPLCREVDSDHPLFIFSVKNAGGVVSSQDLIDAWETCPAELQPFAEILLRKTTSGSSNDCVAEYKTVLDALQPLSIPIALVICEKEPRYRVSTTAIGDLLNDYTCIKSVLVRGITFDEYYPFFDCEEDVPLPDLPWLLNLLDVVPQYGRHVVIEFDALNMCRMMSHAACKSLYDKIRSRASYVLPVISYRGTHLLPQLSAGMGFWLEGAVAQWGVAPSSQWYVDARYIAPGVFGVPSGPDCMPSALYRAMILNGTMMGASVYLFERADDLWKGVSSRTWSEAIYPTLLDILYKRLVPSHDLVQEKAKVVYQLALSRTPEDFHFNLRDIDAEYDQGLLLYGAYGLEKPGQVSEIIPNSGRHYWVPLVSSFAPADVLQSFTRVVQPGIYNTAQSWTGFLDQVYEPDGEGAAFICRVGRGIYIWNTRENMPEPQRFRIPSVPSPVRQIEARRTPEGVVLSWPFREGDVGYRVYKRILPDTLFRRVVDDQSERTWTDTSVGQGEEVSYSVTALTNEEEPYEGSVSFGEYLALSTVESRLAEEVVMGPLLDTAKSRPIETSPQLLPVRESWWDSGQALNDAQKVVAEEIARRIESLDTAFAGENLEGVMDLYHPDYSDAQGWGLQYVRRAYQWFFERYTRCKMARQVRNWHFPDEETPQEVDVVLYCRFSGVAVSDVTGRFADQEAYFPRTGNGEVRLTFTKDAGDWRIRYTEPSLPNMKEILSFSIGPYDRFELGEDKYQN